MGKVGKDTYDGNNKYDIKEVLGMSKKRSGARKLGKKERYAVLPTEMQNSIQGFGLGARLLVVVGSPKFDFPLKIRK